MLRVGIVGAAGYTGGELLRLLVHHPAVEVVFAHSESNAGRHVYEVHEGLIGDTDMVFASEMALDEIDVLYMCFGHGKSTAFLAEHAIPSDVRIIDLAQDYRLRGDHDFVYGLPEVNREAIRTARHIANPGCFATAIQLALLPAVQSKSITGDIHINGITGSTGAGQKPGATTHYSWRNDNVSIYKPFTHQHLAEIRQTLTQVDSTFDSRLLFVPQRGCFCRGIFVTAYATCDKTIEEMREIYAAYYSSSPFTHTTTVSPSMKTVVNTNKAVVYVDKYDDQLLMIACIDNLLKGAVGQAVENMNIMFSLSETTGLGLKATAF